MRGGVDRSVLEPIAAAAGGALPELPTERRAITTQDVVILPEGQFPITFAQIALSPARAIMLLLAPPGLFGWPFVEGWSLRDPLEVDVDAVARPEHFRAMAAFGFELWTHSPALLERIREAGLTATLVGAGQPGSLPIPRPKVYDVVTLANNRWASLAREVVSQLPPSVVHHEIPSTSNERVLEAFGQARVLVHPLRLEGDSRIGQEARAMGAVPVVLDTNPFNVGLDEAGGAVAVSTLEEMPDAVMALLRNPERLRTLRERAMATAREQVDWDRYVERIDAALSRGVAEDPARGARAVMGGALAAREAELVEEFSAQSQELRDELTKTRRAYDELVTDRDVVVMQMHHMKQTRAWRLAAAYRRMRDRLRGRYPADRAQ